MAIVRNRTGDIRVWERRMGDRGVCYKIIPVVNEKLMESCIRFVAQRMVWKD